jgi:hypothetical protein
MSNLSISSTIILLNIFKNHLIVEQLNKTGISDKIFGLSFFILMYFQFMSLWFIIYKYVYLKKIL